jgi:hypothetical protein
MATGLAMKGVGAYPVRFFGDLRSYLVGGELQSRLLNGARAALARRSAR